MGQSSKAREHADPWQKVFEEQTQAWVTMMEQMGQVGRTAEAVDPAAFWRPVMDPAIAAWARVMGEGPVTPDVLTQWKRFLDQWLALWSSAFERAMETEAFAQALGKYLEQWLALQGPAQKVAAESTEAMLSAMGVPSRMQVAGIGRQLADLDDRLENLEDRVNVLIARGETAAAGAPPSRRMAQTVDGGTRAQKGPGRPAKRPAEKSSGKGRRR